MTINKDTKISDIISENREAIDVIASINKNFKKLKNPFLRKLLAPRVRVKDAAKIGDTKINILLQKLKNIGFQVEFVDYDIDNKTLEIKNIKYKNMDKSKLVKLDVRPILDKGVDPYQAIMETLRNMSDDETLLIINTFEPIPLLNKLSTKGYTYEVERPEDMLVHTFLTKTGKAEIEKEPERKKTISFAEAELEFKGKMKEVDVRDLEMPMPMVTILQEIETVQRGGALFVHHKRLPQYLLPELENRGYVYVSKEIDDENIKFIIFKENN